MNAIIIEDEIEAAERLATLLKVCDPDIRIVNTIESVQDAVQYFQGNAKPDVVFMDIQLADGKSFEIFERVEIDSPIVFTTAFDQYTLQAFKLHSIDYLLKPIQSTDLSTAIQKLKRLSPPSTHLTYSDVQALKEIISSARNKFKQRLLIKSGNKLHYKQTQSVCYFYADGKTTYLVGRDDGKRFIIDHTLEELERMLDPEQFFRISRKFIVNVDCVVELKGLISSRLEVRLSQPCEHELAVSRERAHDLKAWLDR